MPDPASAESPEPESPQPESPQPSPQPESREPGPQSELPAAHKRSVRKILTPLVLAALGLALLLFGILFYPTGATGLRSPPYSRLGISTTFPIALIGLKVVQASPAIAEMKFSVELPAGTTAPPAGGGPGRGPANRDSLPDCPPPFCRTLPGALPGSLWGKQLAFRSTRGSVGVATADFFVKAASFGVAFNGVTATAAIPEFIYRGPGTPMLVAAYEIPSAASYDWSSFPTAAVNNTTATWQEDLASTDTPGRSAVGINPADQANHDIRALVAGTLLGLAGGAIISAVQEFLHVLA